MLIEPAGKVVWTNIPNRGGGVCKGICSLSGSESCKWLYTCPQNEPLLLFAKHALQDLSFMSQKKGNLN